MSISLFNPLSPKQNSDYSDVRVQLQEIVDYAESRFRSILVNVNKDLNKSDIDRISWTQKLLQRELTFVLSLIGTLTALGQPVDVPIIISTLAGSIALCDDEDFPLSSSPDVLAILDAGELDAGQFALKVVTNFELNWWSGRKPRDLNAVKILNASTVNMCLEHYTSELESQAGSRIIPNPASGAGLTSKALLYHDAVMAGKVGKSAGKSAGKSRSHPTPIPGADSSAPAGPKNSCQSCPKYKQLLHDVLRDIVKHRNFASDMGTASKNLFVLGVRRSSTFNLLYEAAVLKETAGVSPPAPASTVQHITNVRCNASSDLDRLNDLPASSYKWTWGELLTEEDVLGLRRPGTKPGRIAHSGYDISLVQGRMEGEYSEGPSNNLPSNGMNDELPEEASIIPPSTDLQLPKFFSNKDIRVYDPLHSLPNPPNILIPSTVSGLPDVEPVLLPATTLADNWSASGDDDMPVFNTGQVPGTSALDLAKLWHDLDSGAGDDELAGPSALDMADTWSNGSDDEQAFQPAPVGPSALDMADTWSTGSNDQPAIHPALAGPSTLDMADTWSSGSNDQPAIHPAQVPVTNLDAPALAEKLEPASDSNALQLAENWFADTEEAPVPVANALNIADEWSENEREEPVPPGRSQASVLADVWMSSEGSGGEGNASADEKPYQKEVGRRYGPKDFSLNIDMFEDQDSSDGEY